MVDTSPTIDFDNNDQIRLLKNLREDIKILLNAHPTGIWYRMLPKVFYMHFNRDIHLDLFGITNSYLLLDYISDLIKFDLPENFLEEDFIIELNNNNKENLSESIRTKDLKLRRDVLFNMLQNATLEKRGAVLREICIIDEYLKDMNDQEEEEEEEILPPPPPKIPTSEQMTIRFQKLRSIIDFYIRYFLKSSDEIPNQELIELDQYSQEFLDHLTPLAQRLSLSKN